MNSNIYYLTDYDVVGDSLKDNVTNGKPVVVFCMSNFCGHCINVKPTYQQVADSRPDIMWCAIQMEDNQLRDKLKIWHPEMVGIPVFLGFDKFGKFKKVYSGNRSADSIDNFATSLK